MRAGAAAHVALAGVNLTRIDHELRLSQTSFNLKPHMCTVLPGVRMSMHMPFNRALGTLALCARLARLHPVPSPGKLKPTECELLI